MKLITHITTALAMLLLASCMQGDNFSDLQQFTVEVKARPGGEIEPVPEFKAYEAFTYSAAGYRSPFDIPIRIRLQEGISASENVRPDLNGKKQHLESYEIAE